jgi:hypothetical protein
MKTINALVLLLALLALTSCNTSKDGKYIIVNIASEDKNLPNLNTCYGDTVNGRSIASYLKDKMQGRKYQIKIKEDFAIIKDLEENEDTVLAFKTDADGDYYSTEVSKGNGKETFNIQLRPDVGGKIALIVDLKAERTVSYIPVQLGGRLNWDQCGRAICYLSKLD